MIKHTSNGPAIAAGLCATMLALAACSQQGANSAGPASSASAPAASSTAPASSSSAAAPQAYTPPTADQLYQLVAPIALFPDKLVAQVLAGSTYPDQITAAQNLVTQNPNLKGDLLQAAVQPQSWDPSVKGLTQFPSVLGQMAQNVQWTTALGQAYVNDPTDVLNAIQVMRQRAAAQGNLRSSAQQQVSTQPAQQVVQSEDQSGYVDNSGEPVYSGPSVVPPPGQIIQIEPAQPDAVYVPSYDPQTVYGGEVPYYPSYQYAQPGYSTGEVVAVGAVAFGAAIVIGSLLDNHHDRGGGGGGWHSWGMNWGGGGGRGGYNGGGPDGGGRHPAVVYNNQTYVSRSTTVVNRYTTINNVTNNRYNNTVNNNRTFNNGAPANVPNNVAGNRNEFNRVPNNLAHNTGTNPHPAGQPMSVPNFSRAGFAPAAAPHAATPAEARPGQAPHPGEAARPNLVHQGANAPAGARPAVTPHVQPGVPHQQPAVARPAQQVPHPAPQPQRTQPAFHPAPAQQPHPATPRPQPQVQHAAPQQHPQPQPQPQHAAPQQRPQPQPQARPAPQPQHQNNGNAHEPPPKKKDDKQH